MSRPMTDTARENWNEYQRNYRAKNRDKVREWRLRYYLRKADAIREQERAEAEKREGGAADGGN